MSNDNALEHSGNTPEQKGTGWVWRNLTAKELQAIEMRFQGKTSSEIAAATKYRANYVRKLFMRGGRLRQAYDDFAVYHKDGLKEAADLVIQRAKEEAPKAMERMVALAEDRENGPVCFKANEKIIEWGGVSAKLNAFPNQTLNLTQINITGNETPDQLWDLTRKLIGGE